LQLVLQFGGASGLGMAATRGRGPQARRDGAAPPGERREIKFPRPRYRGVIVMNPARFSYLPVPDAPGVRRKHLGSFTERAFWIEYVKIESGARWTSTVDEGRRLLVALSGESTVDDTKIGRLAALQVEAGETLRVDTSEEMVLYVVGLPPVRVPDIPSDQFDIVTSDRAIEFENADDREEPR
jgi:hypothetical protein